MGPVRKRTGPIDFRGETKLDRLGIISPRFGYPWALVSISGGGAGRFGGATAAPNKVGRCPLDVLLVTDAADFESALPGLGSFTRAVRREPLSETINGHYQAADVAIIDGRTDLAAARKACRRLTASAPALPGVAVLAPADFLEAHGDWQFGDLLLAAAAAARLPTPFGIPATGGPRSPAGTLQYGGRAP